MKKISFLVLGALLILTSCTYQKNNRIVQADVNEGNKRVYGESLDAPAKQLANKYEDDPKLAKKAEDIRQKLFGEEK